MMNKQGRATTGTAHNYGEFETISGNRGLDHEEPLIFELGRAGKCGVDLPEPEIKHSEVAGKGYNECPHAVARRAKMMNYKRREKKPNQKCTYIAYPG